MPPNPFDGSPSRGKLNASLSTLGYAVAGIFAASWLASSLIYRLRGCGRVEIG